MTERQRRWHYRRTRARKSLVASLVEELRIQRLIQRRRDEQDWFAVGILERDLKTHRLKLAAANAKVAIAEFYLMRCDGKFKAMVEEMAAKL